jgi:hypothetical protein
MSLPTNRLIVRLTPVRDRGTGTATRQFWGTLFTNRLQLALVDAGVISMVVVLKDEVSSFPVMTASVVML